MRLSKRRRSHLPRINMTSMIDIVFLLIIFFMTVSQVSKANNERLELPKLAGSEDQEPSTVIVNIDRQGQIIVSGNKVTLSEFLSVVVNEMQRKGNNPALVKVVLRVDERGDSKTVNEVVTALGRLQIQRVRIAVEVPQ